MPDPLENAPSQGTADTKADAAPVADGSNFALATSLFRSDRPALIAFLRRELGGNLAAAEDMAQEAIVRIASATRQYTSDRARGLLYSIARNLVIDHVRSERTRNGTMQALSVTQQDLEARNPLRTLVGREHLDQVRAAIMALPPRCRQVFMLNRFEHMSYSAIARHCGISVSMVEKHMNRALRAVTVALDEDGVASNAGDDGTV